MSIAATQPGGPARRYHVGNVRATLLDHAADLLNEGGPAGLNLRTLSARTGVALGSVYHHFSSKADLLAALAVDGFVELGDALRRASTQSRGRIIADCVRAHFDFARRKPQLYSLMFEAGCAKTPAVAAARQSTFQVLEAAIEMAAARIGRPMAKVQSVAVAVWTCAHGAASLAPIQDEGGDLVGDMIRGLEELFMAARENQAYPNTVQAP